MTMTIQQRRCLAGKNPYELPSRHQANLSDHQARIERDYWQQQNAAALEGTY